MKKTLIGALMALLISSNAFAVTVMTVNGEKVDGNELNRRVQIFERNNSNKTVDKSELKKDLLEGLAIETVVVQEAKRLRLHETKEFKTTTANILAELKANGEDKKEGFKASWQALENRLLMDAYAQYVLQKDPITDAQLEEAYNKAQKHINKYYQGTDEIELGYIVTQKPEQAQAAIKELSKTKNFAAVARKYSIDPNAQSDKGLFLPFQPMIGLQREQPTLHAAVVNLKKGEYTKTPISDDNNLQFVFYVNDKRKININPKELKEMTLEALSQRRAEEAINQLFNKAKIVYNNN